jgi:hypothetical protein
MQKFGWYYPPGASNGPDVGDVGPIPCANCGHEPEEHDPVRYYCLYCRCGEYTDEPPEPDPDELYDRRREEF